MLILCVLGVSHNNPSDFLPHAKFAKSAKFLELLILCGLGGLGVRFILDADSRSFTSREVREVREVF